MLPNFKSNQLVLAVKTKNLYVNDVVILSTSDSGEIIKRISSIEDNHIKVTGDNMEYNSRHYSEIFNTDNVIGKVFFKISLF